MRCEHCDRIVSNTHPYNGEKLCFDCMTIAVQIDNEKKHKRAWETLKRLAKKERNENGG